MGTVAPSPTSSSISNNNSRTYRHIHPATTTASKHPSSSHTTSLHPHTSHTISHNRPHSRHTTSHNLCSSHITSSSSSNNPLGVV